MIFRRIIAALALLCAAIAPAQAQKTKAALNAEIGVSFPDNVVGAITPQILRNVTGDIVNSIMPTAPVVSGNLACFNGTTGLLQDCGSAPSAVIQNASANQVWAGPASGGAAAPGFRALVATDLPAPRVISVTDPAYGAKGDCATDDTAAFQAAWNAAKGTSGFGKIRVPATTTCYLVGAFNGTNANNVIIEGDGDQSLIKINGQDAQGNWWDLSGSNNIEFRNLKFIDNGSAVRIAFLWACTGTNCGNGVIGGLIFDHVNVNAKFVLAGLFAYGYGVLNAPSFATAGGALALTNGTWVNTNNPGVLNGAETRTATISLSAYNAGSVRSVYQTLTTSTAIANQTYIANFNAIDAATTGTTLSNNAAMVTDGVNQFTMIGGSLQCLCIADFIGWTSDEGLTFIQTAFEQPNGTTACTTTNWMEFGGGVNAAITLLTPFWSCPGASGAYIALDQGVSATGGGIWFLTVYGNDVGLNTNNDPFIGKTAAGCGSFTATNNWILGSNLNLIAGANNIVSCGGIDSSTILQLPGTITLTGAAVDASLHVPSSRFEWVNWAPGGTTINAKSSGVSTISRAGAGQYTVNFSPSWANINYVCHYAVIDTGGVTWSTAGGAAQTVSAAALIIRVASTGVLTDPTTVIAAQCSGTR